MFGSVSSSDLVLLFRKVVVLAKNRIFKRIVKIEVAQTEIPWLLVSKQAGSYISHKATELYLLLDFPCR